MSSRKAYRQRRSEPNADAVPVPGGEPGAAAPETPEDRTVVDAPVSLPNGAAAVPERYAGDQQLGSKLTYMAIVVTLLVVMKFALGW